VRIRTLRTVTPPPLRTTDLLVLTVLVDGPQHGYGIAQAISARTRGQLTIRPGDLYRVLYRMDRAGLIEPAPESSRRRDSDERRVNYRITPLGRRVAWAQAALLSEICAGLLRGAAHPGGVV
jgi:DNA-binding PadR family transcriptional regulator